MRHTLTPAHNPFPAHTDSQQVRQRLNMRWGVLPFRIDFSNDPEVTVAASFALLKSRRLLTPGDVCVVVSDLRPSEHEIIRSAQVRMAN